MTPNRNRIATMKSEEMITDEQREELIKVLESGEIPPSQYKNLAYMLGLIEVEPGPHVLENGMVIEEVVAQWAKVIKPENLIGVFSALRDCEDPARQRKIIDTMISAAYKRANTTETEEEWRRRVETKLREQ
jgi:hypothetical protein